MHSGHGHFVPGASQSASSRHERTMKWALALTVTYMVAEVVGGLLTGSLALLADAAHMLTDAGGLLLALLAIRFARSPATPQKTYGYLRAEILAALCNAIVLLLLTVYILSEAYKRFLAPPEVIGGPMLIVAVIGLAVNFISMRLLAAGSSESINVKGAYFEVLADMLGSLGVIIAALTIMLTGWQLADPIIGAAIGLFIVPRTWILLKQITHILLEGTPPEIDVSLLTAEIKAIPEVVDVHDLHVWTITSGLDAMSAHVDVVRMDHAAAVLSQIRKLMAEKFKIGHITVQIEDEHLRKEEPHGNV
jgi:cobalt-zinc-cadmium efflux system protein